MALAGLVGYVQPACPVAHGVLKEQLVEVEVGGYVGIHLAPRLHARYVYVGSLAPHVLRGVSPAHYGVEPLGAESARYAYHAEAPAQRFQHVQAELPEAFGLFSVGRVVYAVSYCRARAAHLLQREVFRQSCLCVLVHCLVFYGLLMFFMVTLPLRCLFSACILSWRRAGCASACSTSASSSG